MTEDRRRQKTMMFVAVIQHFELSYKMITKKRLQKKRHRQGEQENKIDAKDLKRL